MIKRAMIPVAVVCVGFAALAASAQAAATPVKQYDGERTDFRLEGRPAFIVFPKDKPATGPIPWVWFAPVLRDRYPDKWHEWLFTRFVQNGIAVAGIDADETWGNPEGRAMFTKFYEHVVGEFRLSPKPCLFAQTRGMLMHLNWAVEHPKCVQCIGAIYPLCHITNTPFFSRVYKLGEDPSDDKQNEAALAAKYTENNPMDRLAPLAKEEVPFFLMHGGEDQLVPLTSNSAALADAYKKLGGTATLLIRRTGKHEPSVDFFESEEFLKFFLTNAKATEKKTEPGARGTEPPKPPAEPKPESKTP